MRLRVGIDCGKVQDNTAIVICEVVTELDGGPERDPRTKEPLYRARHLERIPLGTSYPMAAVRVREIIERLHVKFPVFIPELYVDATGVGLAVIDIFRGELRGVRHRLVPVTTTYGDGYHWVPAQFGPQERPARLRLRRPPIANGLTVGKGFIVSRLQSLLQTKRLLLPGIPEARVLQDQLRDFQIRAKVTGEQSGAKPGSHDDLVLAAALAVLDKPRADVVNLDAANRYLARPSALLSRRPI